jgi:WD40 repeat protein
LARSGKYLAISDDSIKVYDLANDKLVSRFGRRSSLLRFSPSAEKLVAISTAGTVTVWDLTSSREVVVLHDPFKDEDVIDARFDSSEARIILSNGTVASAISGEILSRLPPHDYPIVLTGFDPTTQQPLTIDQKGRLVVWSQTQASNTATRLLCSASTMRFTSDGWLAILDRPHATGYLAYLDVINSDDPSKTVCSIGPTSQTPFGVSQTTIATLSEAHEVLLWDVASGQVRSRLKYNQRDNEGLIPLATTREDFGNFLSSNPADLELSHLAMTSDGQRLALVYSDGVIIIRLADDDREEKTIPIVLDKSQAVTSVALSIDGTQLFVALENGSITLFASETGEKQKTLRIPPTEAISMAVNPAGDLLAIASPSSGKVRIIDVKSDTVARELRPGSDDGYERDIIDVGFTDDGKLLGYFDSRRKEIILFDLATGNEVSRQHTGDASGILSFGHDRFLGVSIVPRHLYVWDGTSERPNFQLRIQVMPRMPGQIYFESPSFTPAVFGRDHTLCLVTTDYDTQLWNTTTNQRLFSEPIWLNVDFSADDQYCLAFCESGGVVWDASNGQELFRSSQPIMQGYSVPVSEHEPNKLASTYALLDRISGKELLRPLPPAWFLNPEEMPTNVTMRTEGRRAAVLWSTGQISVFVVKDGSLASQCNTFNIPVTEFKSWVETPEGTFERIQFEPMLRDARMMFDATDRYLGLDGYIDGPENDHEPTFEVWDVLQGECIFRTKQKLDPEARPDLFSGTSSRSRNVAFRPDGTQVAFCLGNGTTEIWNLNPVRRLKTVEFQGALAWPNPPTLLISDLSQRIVWLDTNDWHIIRTTSVPSKQLPQPGQKQTPAQLFVSNDGKKCSAVSAGRTAVYDVSSGRLLLTAKDRVRDTDNCYFSREDKGRSLTLVTRKEGVGTVRGTIETRKRVLDAAAFPDMTRIVTLEVDLAVRLWDTKSGIELMTLREPQTLNELARHFIFSGTELEGNHILVSPDGNRIAAIDADGSVTLWDGTWP